MSSRTSGPPPALPASVVVLSVAALLAGCVASEVAAAPPVSAERDGLRLEARLSSTSGSLIIESRLENSGGGRALLVPDQCGRLTEALLARTVRRPWGRAWTGSAAALKGLLRRSQDFEERPDRFHPRRPGDPSQQRPDCSRPAGPVPLEPGASVGERWELRLDESRTLREVGSAAGLVRVEAVVARGPGAIEYLDFQWEGMADEERAGRSIRVEVPAASVIDRDPTEVDGGLGAGPLFDRLLEDAGLRAWVEAQPEDGWRHVELGPDWQDASRLRFSALTTAYERRLRASADAEGRGVSFEAPGEADRTRVFPRDPASLPQGVPLIEEPDPWSPTGDLLPGSVHLPSGRIAVGEFLFDDEVLEIEVPPGDYPVRATLARAARGDERVALATLELSDAPTVEWRYAYAFPVDGGTTNITSLEGARAEAAAMERDERAWMERTMERSDSLSAHDHLATHVTLGGDLDLVLLGSGVGDGQYPVFVGHDASGRPTRVVVDFGLLHLDWPVPEASD